MSTTSFIISDRVGLFASEACATVDRLSSRRKYYAYSTLKAPDKGEVGGSSPSRPTNDLTALQLAMVPSGGLAYRRWPSRNIPRGMAGSGDQSSLSSKPSFLL